MTLDRARVERFFTRQSPTLIEKIELAELSEAGVNLWIKRDDLTDSHVSGNKFRKLKYNLLHACDLKADRILSFGGAYSNHIHALAAIGKQLDVETIGVIRGEELDGENPTLRFARNCGMKLHFISRAQYRSKYDPSFLQTLEATFGDFYMVPEGGTNEYAIAGCAQLAQEIEAQVKPDYVCVACGTGGTLAGLVSGLTGVDEVIGFPVLKGVNFLEAEIQGLLSGDVRIAWRLVHDYHFGGYARMTPTLSDFMARFYHQTGVQLDPVYTAKMIYGVLDMIAKGHFPRESNIVVIHTGGLQGLDGMSDRFCLDNSVS